MKRTTIILITVATLALGSGTLFAGNGPGQGYQGGTKSNSACSQVFTDYLASLPMEQPDEAETASLVKMRQEEKLARDVYLTLQLQWGARIFANIARAEQKHMDMVKTILDRYGIEDPVTDDTIGIFPDDTFVQLYEQLVEAGGGSLEDALTVGATIEDLDIYDLEEAMSNEIDNADIKAVYQNLTKGSRNHMRAFTSQLASYDIEYSAQYISAEELESIINSEWERGTILDADGEVLANCGGGNGGRNGGGNGRGTGDCTGNGPSGRSGSVTRVVPGPPAR